VVLRYKGYTFLADPFGRSAKELRDLAKGAKANKDLFAKAWKDFFHE
jgi:hypothetical protein